MKNILAGFYSAGIFLLLSCKSQTSQPVTEKATEKVVEQVKADSVPPKKDAVVADAATILSKVQVPVLCYHQIREWKGNESRLAKDVVVPPAKFRNQMQILADSGYQTILPDQLYDYLTKGTPLPPKPVILTYDDGDVDQYNIAAPEMAKHGFKGVFFIMTVSMGRSIYMNKDQIKKLSDEGHEIASHTYDHHDVRKYTEADWDRQLTGSCKQLEAITGKPVKYFAYPFGLWNKEAIPEMKKRNIIAAFQLSTKMDEQDPLYTIRRMIVPGDWSAPAMIGAMKKTFKL